MYGHIRITIPGLTYVIPTNESEAIYDTMTLQGYEHDEAASVASWAPFAAIGEEYELDEGPVTQIIISE